ncbi:MAG: XRE family transcriptional regulator [Gammaproteobacteria bacterium]|nr:MAG: XRE family transcriptional regulator [Gammaproteobacteria bacterium]
MDHRFEPHELVQDSEVFGPALLRVREALDVSRNGLGDHALIASSTIATYETKARDPSVEAIVGIAVACGVEPWSAAQHGHLLLSNRAMRSGNTGVPQLFMLPISARRTRPPVAQAIGLGGVTRVGGAVVPGLAVAMAGGAISNAIRQRRGEASLFEVSDKKLMARVQSATPLPGAVARGLYPLVEPRDRASLERDLIEASRKLSEDDLMALVAALHTEERSTDINS